MINIDYQRTITIFILNKNVIRFNPRRVVPNNVEMLPQDGMGVNLVQSTFPEMKLKQFYGINFIKRYKLLFSYNKQ